jgi:hypothetical protein
MKRADLNHNNAIEWHEYFALLQTFAEVDFGGCMLGQSDSAPLYDQFQVAACSCQGYNASTIAKATITVLPNCTCSKEEATVAIPGIYPEPYITNVCLGMADVLDAVCQEVPFQPKPLRTTTAPSPNETEDEFPDTVVPSVSPLASPTSGTASNAKPKRRNLVPLVASVAAVAAYLAVMAVLYIQNGRHVRQVSQSAEKWSNNVASRQRAVASDDHNDNDDDCTHKDDNSQAEMPIDVEVGSVGNQSGDTGLCTEVDFRLNNSEECVVFDPAYDSANEPLFDRSQSSSDLSLHTRLSADTSSLSLADTSSWLVKSFEKSEFGHTTYPSFNYNDVSAPICSSASCSLSDDDDHNYDDDGVLVYTDDSGDDGDTDNDNSDDDGQHHMGPIDIDNGDVVVMPKKRRLSKAMQKRKKKLPRVRSVKGTREAYKKKAQARSTSSSLKPIPEASLIRSRPFII